MGDFHGANWLCVCMFKNVCLLIQGPFRGLVKLCQFHSQPLTLSAAAGKRTLNTCSVLTCSDMLTCFLPDHGCLCVWLPESIAVSTNRSGTGRPERALGVFVCGVYGQKVAFAQTDTMSRKWEEWRWVKPSDTTEQRIRKTGHCVEVQHRSVICVSLFISYQLPRQEDFFLSSHHHTHTFSLSGAAQHAHQFLLAMACHVYSIHLCAKKRQSTVD